ncbi:unnamed protein product [Musa acuminata var. zebrina]
MPIPGILVRGKVRRDHGGEGVRASDIGGYGARAPVLGGDGGGVPAGARGLVSPASKSPLTISPETPLASCRSWRTETFCVFESRAISRYVQRKYKSSGPDLPGEGSSEESATVDFGWKWILA